MFSKVTNGLELELVNVLTGWLFEMSFISFNAAIFAELSLKFPPLIK